MILLELLGRRWSLRVLWELQDERLTFRELRARCDDVSPTSLNQRLKDLREHNLIDHNEQGYGATKWGKKIGEELLSLNDLSGRWAKELGSEKR